MTTREMNADDSSRLTMDNDDEQPLVSKAASLDKDRQDRDKEKESASEKGTNVTTASAEEAPFGTQIFWLVVWMLK